MFLRVKFKMPKQFVKYDHAKESSLHITKAPRNYSLGPYAFTSGTYFPKKIVFYLLCKFIPSFISNAMYLKSLLVILCAFFDSG